MSAPRPSWPKPDLSDPGADKFDADLHRVTETVRDLISGASAAQAIEVRNAIIELWALCDATFQERLLQ